MIKPVFDITPAESPAIDWATCRLFIEVSSQYLYYAMLNQKGEVLAVKYYHLAARNDAESIPTLKKIWKEDPLLKQPVNDTIVLYHWAESCLVPEKYFDAGLNNQMFEMIYGDLDKSPVLSEKIKGWNIYNLYKVPSELHDFFQNISPSCNYRHYYSRVLECQFAQGNVSEDRVNVIFYPKQIVATVIANSQVHLIRSFTYQTADDVSWYLLNIYQQFNLRQTETPLYIGGMIEQKSSLHAELMKYFMVVKTVPVPENLVVPDQLHTFAGHYFSPLLKLATCEL
jgi:hypothetical protein